MKSFSGIVQKGARRGTELGFPTINIPVSDMEVSGIYAALVKVGEEKYRAAVFADGKRKVLEAYILDFSADLYGWHVTVELLKKIRESKTFPDDTKLKKAISEDIEAARRYFEKV